MKLDAHTHGKLAKILPFSEKYTENLFKEAKKRGVDALFLTEHFNTQEFDKIYDFVKKRYPKDGETYLVEGVRVFPGIEVDMKEGGHNLVIGSFQTIMDLRAEILAISSYTEFLPAAKLFPLIKQSDVLFGAAHVFREGCHNLELSDELIAMYDFFDLNGKDTGLMGLSNYHNILEVAKKYQRPVLAGSDTHQFLQYGSVYNDFAKEVNNLADLKAEIAAQRYELVVSETVQEKVEGAGLLKKSLKTIQQLGGSYDMFLGID